MAHLILYGRPDCHLCEAMQSGLDRLRDGLGFSYSIVDVDSSPELARRYGALVPVLTKDGEEICHYFLDAQALHRRLAIDPTDGVAS